MVYTNNSLGNNMAIEQTITLGKKLTFYTDGSAIPNPGFAAYGFYGIDENNTEISGYGPVGIKETNNVAEIMAITNCLNYCNSINNELEVTINADSEYVLKCISSMDEWEKNKWMTKIGKVVKNVQYLKELKKAINTFKEKNGLVTFKWVKGHNGNSGNEKADRLADTGRKALEKGELGHVVLLEPYNPLDIVTTEIVTKVKEKKKKVKVEPLLPLISGKRWFFNTNQSFQLEDGRFFYPTSTYIDDKKTKYRNVGKRNSDTHYSILVTKEPIKELELFRDKLNQHYNGLMLPIEIDLAAVTKSSQWEEINEKQSDAILMKGNLVIASNTSPLGTVLSPPKLVYKLTDIHNYGFTLLNAYETQSNRYQFVDITNNIIVTNSKGIQSIVPEFTIPDKTLIIKSVKINDINTNVKINVGIDIPLRNNFSNLLKVSKEPIKVTLMIFEITMHSYRIATIIEHSNHKCIYYGIDANYRILSPL